jgi:feruloyl esterase
MRHGIGALCVAGGMAVTGCGGTSPSPQTAKPKTNACADLGAASFPNTVVKSAAMHVADPAHQLPAFCEVTALISPVAGSHITAVYRLPEDWNGRMVGSGGGGWAGQLGLLPQNSDALVAGDAVAQTDGGHESTNPIDPGWTRNNPVAVTDFSHRAIHETAVVGKQVVAKYYGKPAHHNYFQGCSTGGRMAMMETQRYPDDYEGVVAGAPVYSLLVQSSTLVRDRIFRAPGAEISAELLVKVNAAVVAACDAADGAIDGVVTNPYACGWEPRAMQCKAAASAGDCLSAPQVKALNEAYRTVKTRNGLVGNYGLTRGSEAGWNPFVPTTADVPRHAMNGDLGALVPLMFGSNDFDVAKFDIEKHQAAVHASAFASEYEAASADLSAFMKRGGKLILWHGLDDPGPSAIATQNYYARAVAQNGAENLRFYAAPGVYHCGGGPGADQVDLLTAMEQWVEFGKAPQNLTARNDRAGFERPLCEWPKLPRYTRGDPNAAASFSCQ